MIAEFAKWNLENSRCLECVLHVRWPSLIHGGIFGLPRNAKKPNFTRMLRWTSNFSAECSQNFSVRHTNKKDNYLALQIYVFAHWTCCEIVPPRHFTHCLRRFSADVTRRKSRAFEPSNRKSELLNTAQNWHFSNICTQIFIFASYKITKTQKYNFSLILRQNQ